jgi:hypothetical protein
VPAASGAIIKMLLTRRVAFRISPPSQLTHGIVSVSPSQANASSLDRRRRWHEGVRHRDKGSFARRGPHGCHAYGAAVDRLLFAPSRACRRRHALAQSARTVRSRRTATAMASKAGIRKFCWRGVIRAVDTRIANGPFRAGTDGGLVSGGSVPTRAKTGMGMGREGRHYRRERMSATGESPPTKECPPRHPLQDCKEFAACAFSC